jgi:hypothetical protein
MDSSLKWISSEGGPLILLEHRLISSWGGAFAPQDETDYDRACAIEDYVGLISVGPGYGLVLGDEPMQTSWSTLTEENGGVLVRWQWARNENAVIRTLHQVPEELWTHTDLSFSKTEGPLLLFDAACPGKNIVSSLTIDLGRGRYSIDFAHYQPDRETSLILHRLTH